MCENSDACKATGNEKGVPHIEVTPELTPQLMEQFRFLFEEWRREDLNQDCLENSGDGDLEALARRTLRWALAA